MLKSSKILVILLTFMILLTSLSKLALEINTASANKSINVNVTIKNVYNKNLYLKKNIKLSSEFNIINILNEMANKQFIKTYEIEDNSIYSITPINYSKIQNKHSNKWHYYINGTEFNSDIKDNILNDNDNIEIVYKNINYNYKSENSVSLFKHNKLDSERVWNDDFNNILRNAVNYIKLNDDNQDYIYAIALSGNFMDIVEFNRLVANINNKQYKDLIDISTTIIGLTFSGINAQNVRGVNLLEKIYNFKDFTQKGSIGVSYMILALDSDNYPVPINALNTREKLIKYLISCQNDDGGFSSQQNPYSNVSDTAIVLTALSKYKYDKHISKVISKGLNFLSKQKYNTCIDLSNVIIMLKSLEISLDDNRFTKYDANLLDNLMDYIDIDGGFKNDISGKSEIYSTELAVIALIAFKNNQNPYIFKTDIKYWDKSNSNQAIQNEKNIVMNLIYSTIVMVVLFLFTIIIIKLTRQKSILEDYNEK